MRLPAIVAAALWLGGIGLVAVSVAEGGATVGLVVILPVVFGSSATFVAGVGLILAGFVAWMFSFSEPWEDARPPAPSPESRADAAPRSGGVGGFVLIGPVPIVFGSWRGISRRQRWSLALAGAVLLIVVVLVTAWLLR